MDDFIKCSRCDKVSIGEEYDTHDCSAIRIGSKTIKISSFYNTKDSLGRDVIHAWGLDGIIYDLVIILENKDLTKIPFTDQPTGNTDKNNRRSKRICSRVLYNLRHIY